MITLEDVKRLLIDAMALGPEEHHDWVRHAEARLYAHRARAQPFQTMYAVDTVGARIRTARAALGMSQEQLAIRLRVFQGDVSGWERGKRNLPAELLSRLCAVLGVKREWLLGESEEGGPDIPGAQMRRHVTRRWRQKRDYLAQKQAAKAEAEKLNHAYQRRKEA